VRNAANSPMATTLKMFRDDFMSDDVFAILQQGHGAL
jgi:hypothetical protein